MIRREFAILGLAALAGCGKRQDPSKFQPYYGPEVSHVIVQKARRRMYIMNDAEVLRAYDIDLGFAPRGHKFKRGDGRTPEGWYWIDRRNQNSKYHLSLGISYPNARDRARAKAAGVNPGGDIFIHGGPRYDGEFGRDDWTHGCISVTDAEMSEIFAMIPTGTLIRINP